MPQLNHSRLAERARLTEPLSDQEYRVPKHAYLRVNCSGTGTPTPNITLYAEDNGGELVVSRESVGTPIEVLLIVNKPYKFHCNVSNYITSQQGYVERAVDTHSITVTPIERDGAN